MDITIMLKRKLPKFIRKYTRKPFDEMDLFYRIAKPGQYEYKDDGSPANYEGFAQAKSPVMNWYVLQMFQAGYPCEDALFGYGKLCLRDTGGTLRNDVNRPAQYGRANSIWQTYNSAASNNNYGIFVGTSNTAWDILQYNLQAKCSEGAGANQLNYGATTKVSTVYTGASKKWETLWRRSATNNSGADIDCYEMGLIAQAIFLSGSSIYNCLVFRETFAIYTIASLDVVNLEYLFRAYFPY